jgi:hypothetical protein
MIFKIINPPRQINHNQRSEDTMIYPEVHVLAGTLVPVMSPLHHVVRWLISLTPSLSKDATRSYQMARSCNDTRNILMLPYGTLLGKVQTPHKIMGGGQEQSPTLATLLSCSKPSRWWQPPRVTRKTIANHSPKCL